MVGPVLISGVRGLLKWMDCLEGTEVVLFPPAFLKPLDHPWSAEFRGIWWFFRTVLCINFFTGCSEVTDPTGPLCVAVSGHSSPGCPSSQSDYSTSNVSMHSWHLLKGQFKRKSSRGIKQTNVSQNGWLCIQTNAGFFSWNWKWSGNNKFSSENWLKKQKK